MERQTLSAPLAAIEMESVGTKPNCRKEPLPGLTIACFEEPV